MTSKGDVSRFMAACVLAMCGCKGSEDMGTLIAPGPVGDHLVIPVRVIVGHGVRIARAKAALQKAQNVLSGCGLALRETHPAQRAPMATLFPAQLSDAGLGSDEHRVGESLRNIVARLAPPDSDAVQVVLLGTLSIDGSVARRALGELNGLGLRSGDPALAKLGLPETFGPIVFARPEGVTIAHELGHALGLDHVQSRVGSPPNLMTPRQQGLTTCRLDDRQLSVVHAHVERLREQRK